MNPFYLGGAISLPRYAKIIGYSDCQFFGVSNSGDTIYSCRDIWTKRQREEVADYLREAQDMIEGVAGYPLSPTWIADERHDFISPVISKMGTIIASGIQAYEDIELCSPFILTAPSTGVLSTVTVGPIATTVTDPGEIHIFYPGEDQEIIPEKITIAGGFVTIRIPRCRLVKYDLQDNSETGLEYSDDDNFETCVDVKRVYTDTSTQAVIIAKRLNCNDRCADVEYTGCQHLTKPELGIMGISMATYSEGVWIRSCLTGCDVPFALKINYFAGLQTLTRQAESAIIRLAHSLMPEAPCGCEDAKRLWSRDRTQPDVLTAERLNCPFGLSDGAWVSWKFANTLSLGASSALGATKI